MVKLSTFRAFATAGLHIYNNICSSVGMVGTHFNLSSKGLSTVHHGSRSNQLNCVRTALLIKIEPVSVHYGHACTPPHDN